MDFNEQDRCAAFVPMIPLHLGLYTLLKTSRFAGP